MNAPDAATRFGSGRAVPRIEDKALLEGRGRFADNVVFTGADLDAAGVKGMPTTPDFRRADGRRTATALRRGLAHEFARYVGEAVAAVVAESREQARDALEAIGLDMEELPA